MQRVIKFRAFNKASEIMYYPEATPGNYNHYLQVGTEGFWLYNKDGQLICCSERGDVLMQYTGLKDKNGKEIYEGDVLRAKFGTGMGGKSTRYKEMNYTIQYHDASHAFIIIMPKGYGDFRFCPNISSSVVVGNIMNNPELNPLEGERSNMNTDPNVKAEGQEPTTEQVASTEQEAQEQAMESEETEG